MKGDFTRDTFDPLKHFSRVLMQQGRVTLDADANEQAAILLHYARTLARDIIGPYAAPADAAGSFQLTADPDGVFTIGKGRYYVDGILVENDTDNCTYRKQPNFPVPDDDALLAAPGNSNAAPTFLIYLDVWERHITSLEDDSIREKALNGPDTCTRAQVVWQVKALLQTEEMKSDWDAASKQLEAELTKRYTARLDLQKQFDGATDPAARLKLFRQMQAMDEELARFNRLSFLPSHEKVLSHLVPLSKASLAARVDPGIKIEDACVTPPESKYRGLENHLYRVEIHRGGKVGDKNQPPTFKWSRDNGSVATAWFETSGNDLQVLSARGFAAGNWVELSDDTSELLGKSGALVKLAKVEGNTLTADPSVPLPDRSDYPVNPKVRRWDQDQRKKTNTVFVDGTVQIQEPAAGAKLWIDLEDGLQIQFTAGGEYRAGDYWLIPARVATGKIECPTADDLNPQPLPPRGVQHHFALLGSVQWSNNETQIGSQRCVFWPLLTHLTESVAQLESRDGIRPMAASAPIEAPARVRKKVAKPRRRTRPETAPAAPADSPV